MQETVAQRFEAEGIRLGGKALERLDRYIGLLEEWNSVHNLSGGKSREAVVDNLLDALYPTTFLDAPGSLLDVGTGAGFPGLILAIVWDQTEVSLCEPLNKRAAFLRLAALELGLERVKVVRSRVENFHHDPFDLISSRAVTNTELLLRLTRHLSDQKTRWLLYKGSRLQEELRLLEGFGRVEIHERSPRRYLLLEHS